MWTTAQIRRQLAQMIETKPFSIREFLACGARAAVDQAFARLVRNGEVIRVARGLYIKPNSPSPSVLEVAAAKAAAFKRRLAIHGSQAALLLNIGKPPSQNQNCNEYIFATSGRSSSFRFGKEIIRFIGTADRKLELGNSKPGLLIRSLWYLGKEACGIETASQAVSSFARSERQDLRKHSGLMPGWMQELFFLIKRYWQRRQQSELQQADWLESRDPSLSPVLLKRQAYAQFSEESSDNQYQDKNNFSPT